MSQMPAPISLDDLNTMAADAFVAALGDVFEHAPWVAGQAVAERPFTTVADLHAAMMRAVHGAPRDMQLALLRGHPELGGKIARAGAMTADSLAEQGSLGLDRLGAEEFARFEQINAAYRKNFGFPFIICVRRHTRDSILGNFARRAGNDPATELSTALAEVGFITRLRLAAKVDGPGRPRIEGRLSTHVLDMLHGRPAGKLRVELFEVGASARGLIASAVTNADGRTDRPLLSGTPLRIGTYELVFHVGDYFSGQDVAVANPPYLDAVPVRFAIAEPEGDYHVPLLVTPWSYATYRGS